MNKWAEINMLLDRIDDGELKFYLEDWKRLKKIEIKTKKGGF